MNSARRKFLKKGLLGLLSLSLIPASFSFLKQKGYLFSVKDLFAQLDFEEGLLSAGYLAENFKQTIEETNQISRNGRVFYAKNICCVQESNHYSPGFKDNMVSIYENMGGGYEKVVSLNEMELKSLANMVADLKQTHDFSDGKELQRLLIPTLKSNKHRITNNGINARGITKDGYYTAKGYCSMHIKAEGNRYKINTRLLNFKKIVTYQNGFELQGIV